MSNAAGSTQVFSDEASRGLDLATWKAGPFLFGFGRRHLSMETLSAGFPELEWEHLKQVHSATVVESTKPSDPRSAVGAYALIEADAHFTTVPKLAAVIKTADCVPVLIACASDDQPPAVCAIHAGWRGVQTDIVQNSMRALLQRGYAPLKMTVAIGPHILLKSFEVGLDVARNLKEAANRAGVSNPQSVIHPHSLDDAKRMVDLETIVRYQLTSFAVPNSSIHTLAIDTKTSPAWASYRRDGANAGRNLSFVAKLSNS